MATNKTKVLIALVFFLLLITLGLSSKLLNTDENKPEPQIQSQKTLDFYQFSQLLATNNYASLALLSGALDLKPLITKNTIVFNSSKQDYKTQFINPIVLNSSFKILLNFDNQNTKSEVILSGKENLQTNVWWEHIHQLRVGYNSKKLYLSLFNGLQPNSAYYQELDLVSPPILILEFNDSKGSGVIIKDVSGQELTNIVIANNPELEMKEGLFPYSNLQIGINLPPQGKLKLNQFWFYEFER